ncbi:MAG: 4Fe-4S dicluster domain-containing protein [Bacteroidia bacterium]
MFSTNLLLSTSLFSKLVFAVVLIAGIGLFAWQMREVFKTIRLGRKDDRKDRPGQRLNQMIMVAFGQQKMFKRWIPAVLHLVVYVSFLIINVEVLEIIIDGLFGTHRVLGVFGPLYDGLMAVNEILAVLVIVACVILLIRRQVIKIKRFQGIEMTESKGLIRRRNYSKLDAAVILYTEIILMSALIMFNTADIQLHNMGEGSLASLPGVYPVSSWLASMNFLGTNVSTLHLLEGIGWWGHIIGILLFMNYLPISKHFHVIMAFPNVYYSNTGLDPKGQLDNLNQITEEMKAVLDPEYIPVEDPDAPIRFGAKDVTDLSWKSLMDSYACTECGRCTSVCPANLTGKKLSPRKVVMDVRDRLEEIRKFDLTTNDNGEVIANGSTVAGAEEAAGHALQSDYYLSVEELNACTTCNACVEACPVNIDQVSIIVDLRRHLIMEESNMPEEWGMMSNNIENSGNPWAMPAASRFDWADSE